MLAALVVTVVLASDAAYGQEAGAHVIRPAIPPVWGIAPIGAVIALIFAIKFYAEVKAADEGDPEMIEIAGHVREGAMAYLKRQYGVVTIVFLILAAILAFMGLVLHVQNGIVFFAFLTGGFFSGLCGYLGMRTATMASNRTTAGARGARCGSCRGTRRTRCRCAWATVAPKPGAWGTARALTCTAFAAPRIPGWRPASKSGRRATGRCRAARSTTT